MQTGWEKVLEVGEESADTGVKIQDDDVMTYVIWVDDLSVITLSIRFMDRGQ